MPLRRRTELAAHRAPRPRPPAQWLLPAGPTAMPDTAGNLAGHAPGGNAKGRDTAMAGARAARDRSAVLAGRRAVGAGATRAQASARVSLDRERRHHRARARRIVAVP